MKYVVTCGTFSKISAVNDDPSNNLGLKLFLFSFPPRLNLVRQTLYGSRLQKQASSPLQRHSSLYTPTSRERSHDLVATVHIPVPVSHSQKHIPLGLTESLPPSKYVALLHCFHKCTTA